MFVIEILLVKTISVQLKIIITKLTTEIFDSGDKKDENYAWSYIDTEIVAEVSERIFLVSIPVRVMNTLY